MSNYIDTRDLYERQQELQSLKDTVESAAVELTDAEKDLASCEDDRHRAELEEAVSEAEGNLESAKEAFGPDEEKELAELDDLESEITDWRHGNTMIPEGSFEDYARDFAGDIGAINRDASWPLSYIDWEQAAKELAMDYTTVSYQGEDYYVRS